MDIEKMSKDFEDKSVDNSLQNEMEDLKREIFRLKKIIEQYDLPINEELSDVEYICLKGIENLKAAATSGYMTKDEASTLDTLHKNLRLARGQTDKKQPKSQEQSVENLLKLVEK